MAGSDRRTVGQLWRNAIEAGYADPAYLTRHGDHWHEVGWSDAAERVDLLAHGLLARGIRKGDAFGIFAETALEWVLLDFALLADLASRSSASSHRYELPTLSDRERDVLEVLLEEGDLEAAAIRLGITPSTYRVHLHNAMHKLGVESRLAAITVALRAGLIRAPAPRVATDAKPPGHE